MKNGRMLAPYTGGGDGASGGQSGAFCLGFPLSGEASPPLCRRSTQTCSLGEASPAEEADASSLSPPTLPPSTPPSSFLVNL